MRKLFTSIACTMLLSLLLMPSLLPAAHAQDAVVSYQTFYDQLAPYGQWVSDPQYGNVWVPNEEPGYRPYATRGNWVMTDQGNMWVSDVPWGWACYHYGRWTYNSYYGWVWIPGHEWAPAWVNWRSGGGNYGWAPMGPGQYPGSYYEYPVNYWVFVSPQYLYRPNVYGYYEPRYNERYYNQTVYINETYGSNGSSGSYYYGPRAEAIERETHQPLQVYHVSNSNTPGVASVGGNSVSIYRPAVSAATANTARPANVVTAAQPIGKPQAIATGGRNSQPAFHQEMQKQNPAFSKPNNYSNPTPAQREAIQQSNQGINHTEQARPAQAAPQPANRTEPQSPMNHGIPQNNENRNNPVQNSELNHAQPQNNENRNNPVQNNEMNHTQPQNNEMNRNNPSQNNEMNRNQQQNNHQPSNQRGAQPRQQRPAPSAPGKKK